MLSSQWSKSQPDHTQAYANRKVPSISTGVGLIKYPHLVSFSKSDAWLLSSECGISGEVKRVDGPSFRALRTFESHS